MDFYAYLLKGIGFDVHKTSYFLVCNAKRDDEEFNKRMNFDEYLVPYNWNSDWIENKIDGMVSLMNNHQIPEPNTSCKNCAYSEQYAKLVYNPIEVNDKAIQGNLFWDWIIIDKLFKINRKVKFFENTIFSIFNIWF